MEQRKLKFGNDFPDSEHNFWELNIQRTEKYNQIKIHAFDYILHFFRFQEIIGFGGAWSDAAAIGLHNLNPELRTKVLRSYFSNEGIEYSTARVVISGSDFSNRPYTYDDVDNDWNLTKWSLVREDVEMKVIF
jgi:O-glycosyl hydrolase